MRAERICVADRESVRVSRDGDGRTVGVRAGAELRNPHFAVDAGGDCRPLSRPSLAAYAFCTDVEGLAHDGVHGPHPHSLKVIVERDGTDPAVFAGLIEAAGQWRPRRRRGNRQEVR